MSSTALVKPEVVEGPLAIQPFSPEHLIATSIDKGLPLDTLERLLAMRDKLKAERSREAFFEALSGFQSECPVIEKKQAVLQSGKERYRYASLGDILRVVGPLLHRHRLSYRLEANLELPPRLDKQHLRTFLEAHASSKSVDAPEKWLDEFASKLFELMSKASVGQTTYMHAVCTVHHADGHSESSEFRVPVASDNFMNAIQHHGSARTYAARYAFCDAFGIMTGDEDDDANSLDTAKASGVPARDKPVQAAPARPPESKPQNGHKPAPPKNGVELYAFLKEYEAGLVAEKKCKPGALLQHVREAGLTLGYSDDINKWDEPEQITHAGNSVRAFIAPKPTESYPGVKLADVLRAEGKRIHAAGGCTNEDDLLTHMKAHGKAQGWGEDILKWHGQQLVDGDDEAGRWLREQEERAHGEYQPVEGEVVAG